MRTGGLLIACAALFAAPLARAQIAPLFVIPTESQVTQVLEDSISGIEGVKSIKSVSREEVSQITVEFVLERAPDAAANDVRDRVSRVRTQLPDEVDEPTIAKIEADAQAILWLRLNSDRHGALEISDYADRYVVDRLKTLSWKAKVKSLNTVEYAF